MKLAMLTNYNCPQEKNMIFAVIEDNGDRVIIAPVNCKMPIVPTGLVHKTDIRIVGDTTAK